MMRKLLVLAVLAHTTVASAVTIRVPQDYPAIQIAIQESTVSDTVIVAPGTYYEAISFPGWPLIVQSENPNDPSIVAQTIIDATGLETAVIFGGGEQDTTILAGLTIRGGEYGIHGHGTHATVRKCVVEQSAEVGIREAHGTVESCCVRDCEGFGVFFCNGLFAACTLTECQDKAAEQCHGVFEHCEITRNASWAVFDSDALFDKCDIHNNALGVGAGYGHFHHCRIAGNRGTGLQSAHGSVVNCLIAGNAGSGLVGCSADVLSCTVADNSGRGFSNHTGAISHTVVWANGSGPFQNSTTPVWSVTSDPFFIYRGHWDPGTGIWVKGNYHVAADSCIIDVGDPLYADDSSNPAVDLDGNVRVSGGRVDVGAYEFVTDCVGGDFDEDGMPDACDRDIDNDGIWNTSDECDFTPPGVPVNAQGRPLADLNADCSVDLADFAAFQDAFQR